MHLAMSQTWKIRFSTDSPEVIETGIRPYHFFQESLSLVNEPRESYGTVLDFHETGQFFDYLDFTTNDIAEVMEVDPSTLFRWKKEDRKLSKYRTWQSKACPSPQKPLSDYISRSGVGGDVLG